MRDKYYIIVFEALAKDNNWGLGLFCTAQNPQLFVHQKCRNWIENGLTSGNMNMIYCNKTNSIYDIKSKKYIYHLEEAFLSHKKMSYNAKKRQYVLENYLKYFFIKTKYNTLYSAENEAVKILKQCCKCKYEKIEKLTYKKPKYKWVSEELLYNVIKERYKKYDVIYQYRPDFLLSDKGGQMSYDIFISKLNIAIEYQGKQHFEPVDFFGGKNGFIETQKRDKLKKELSKKNEIKLIYINYWEDITEELIKQKIDSVFS